MSDLVDILWDNTVGHEGAELDLTASDPGNWTGGQVGVGQLRGSKFGISAKRYPDLDIAGLTYAAAKALFVRDFYNAQGCDQLPPALAQLLVDAAYNGGHPIRWLQQALGVATDGILGPKTLGAVATAMQRNADFLLADYQAERLAYLTDLDGWTTDGARDGEPLGWSTRLMRVLAQAIALKLYPAPTPTQRTVS